MNAPEPDNTDTSPRARYERWVTDHSVELYRFALRMTGRGEIAEDLTQETFYHAWRSMKSLRDPSRARAWLFQILRYRYSHWLRDKGRQVKTTAPAEPIENRPGKDRASTLERMTRHESLQLALDDLDERFRTPFLMVFLEGLSCREAAERLGVPLGTVLSRIHRARQALRASLAQQERASERNSSGTRDLRLRGA